MNKLTLTICLMMLGISSYSQTDTIYFSKSDFDIKIEQLKEELIENNEKKNKLFSSKNSELDKKLREYIEAQKNIINELEMKINLNKNKISNNSSNLIITDENIDSIKNESVIIKQKMSFNSTGLNSANNRLSLLMNDTNSKMTTLDDKFTSKTLLIFFLVAFSFIIAVLLFFLLRKKLSENTSKFDDQIENTRKSIHEEHMRLDQKLIEMFESQLKLQKEERKIDKSANKKEDHTLALKVADEIIRMQKNIVNMPEETKGLKQLSRALQRIQDSFKINGYEIIEMLGKTYKEGMKVAASFVSDENLKKEEQIITRIIKPQVNYNGKMIQSAEIEVSIGE